MMTAAGVRIMTGLLTAELKAVGLLWKGRQHARIATQSHADAVAGARPTRP